MKNKLSLLLLLIALLSVNCFAQQTSAKLQIESQTKGFLMPRLTSSQMFGMNNPAEGLMIYNSSENQFFYFNGTTWVAMPSKPASEETDVNIIFNGEYHDLTKMTSIAIALTNNSLSAQSFNFDIDDMELFGPGTKARNPNLHQDITLTGVNISSATIPAGQTQNVVYSLSNIKPTTLGLFRAKWKNGNLNEVKDTTIQNGLTVITTQISIQDELKNTPSGFSTNLIVYLNIPTESWLSMNLNSNHIQLSGPASANITVGNPTPSSLTLTNNLTTVSFPISSTSQLDSGAILYSDFNYTFSSVNGNVTTSASREDTVKSSAIIHNGFTYFEVTSAGTNEVWLDRNVGATRVATAMIDTQAIGGVYQWGRGSDGHELIGSATTNTLASSDDPGHGNFITTSTWDWRSPANNNLWQGVNGANNPCPPGFRVPTQTEIENEINSWTVSGINYEQAAFDSELKLPSVWIRWENGTIPSGIYMWSSTPFQVGAQRVTATSTGTSSNTSKRSQAHPVRCIKD